MSLYCDADELPGLREQFREPLFERDRATLCGDLQTVFAGKLPPTLFSWWCFEIRTAELAGKYQAAQESLLAAHLLLEEERAPKRARELLLEQAEIDRWTDPVYGEDMGHDLASSHFARAFAAGLDCAAPELSASEVDHLAAVWAQKVRAPFVSACYSGNAYLVGERNTNWLGHICGSALLAELALSGHGREDRAALALAKAGVLRYVDFVAQDGSLPENGDYFFYGMEFALLALHAWGLRFGSDLIAEIARSNLRRAIQWPLAFTDQSGFWADFGEAHPGWHEASRVTGYLFARHFASPGGQWLGEGATTREPLAGLVRAPGIAARHNPRRICWFKAEETAAVNFDGQHLALRGGSCRSPRDSVPHRHYDTGSIIYRSGGENLIVDAGFDRYDATFWDAYDAPGHAASSAELHNVVLADGRGFRFEDCAEGELLRCEEPMRGWATLVFRLKRPVPGLAAWERHVILREGGALCVVDEVIPDAAANISVQWHLHEPPRSVGGGIWKTSKLHLGVACNRNSSAAIGEEHSRPCLRIDADAGGEGPVVFASAFGSRADLDAARPDLLRPAVHFGDTTWNIAARTLES